MFEIRREGQRDVVQCAVGLTPAREINMCRAVGVLDLFVTGETVQHEGKSLIAFHITRSFEVFIKHRAD